MERKRILSVDGGGIRGIIPLCAIVELERQLGQPAREVFSLFAGTSTGAIISGGLAVGLSAERCLRIYTELGERAFQGSPLDWLLSKGSYKYRTAPLANLLKEYLGNPRLNELESDILLTAMRVRDGRPFFFVKDNDANERMFGKLRLVDCIAASAAAPTFFEPWNVPTVGPCVDGGVGVTGNPSYQACVEAFDYMPAGTFPIPETTVISLGTGYYKRDAAPDNLIAWVQWIVGELLDEPAEQQTMIIRRHYVPLGLHLQRLNVAMPVDISMDDVRSIPRLVEIGRAAAAKLDWHAILTAPDGTKAVPGPLPRNRPMPANVIKVGRKPSARNLIAKRRKPR